MTRPEERSRADRLESEVRSYSRHAPATFVSAQGSLLRDEDGRTTLDFLSGCGALNYGHNHPDMVRAAIAYLQAGGVLCTMDLRTAARRAFMETFDEIVLKPRGLDYRLQFPGPTGTNAVEAALKLARKATGRTTIVAFTNAFHGVTLGALAATGNKGARAASRPLLGGVARLPFEGYRGAGIEELERYAHAASDPTSGVEPPAAFIVETVQGEGGLNVASIEWLRSLAEIAARLGALLIVDDVQAGCGRAGAFFSFERAGIVPDLVCLSKSLSGAGLPMALVLIRPDRDVWAPGEHNGTFRGNDLAFVTAAAALGLWTDSGFRRGIDDRSRRICAWTKALAAAWPRQHLAPCGLGMMLGVRFSADGVAERVARRAFDRGVLIETAGPRGEVLKLFPALTIDPGVLEDGLERIAAAVADAFAPAELRPELVA